VGLPYIICPITGWAHQSYIIYVLLLGGPTI
jgi:hypothetical protein